MRVRCSRTDSWRPSSREEDRVIYTNAAGGTNPYKLLSADEMLEVAERWRPERTRACLYVWRAADMTRGGFDAG